MISMKISTILDHIDNGHIALPEFQRGYVWNRNQVRVLFDSLYRRHPIGGLLIWATESETATQRGGTPVGGPIKLLLDGQQRVTSLYGVVRGEEPRFFDGNPRAFTGLYFNLDREAFEFYQQNKMKDDPLWIDVTALLKNGEDGHEKLLERLDKHTENSKEAAKYSKRIGKILWILDIELHAEEITGKDMALDVIVGIFNRVNSGGTKLSKGDLAMAKISVEWPDGRDLMKKELDRWAKSGFHFKLDWLLRSVNTALTGEAKFLYLYEKETHAIREALSRAIKHIDTCINLISGRLGLDHDKVLFGRFGVPVMVRYLDQRAQQKLGDMDEKERDKLLFWFAQAAMWGRFSGSTESHIDKDLEAIAAKDGNLDKLLEQLRLWHGGLRAEAGHFTGWGIGARFYSVLYMMTRMGEAKDWGSGLPLKENLLGKMSSLEVHHIFPKARLYKYKEGEFTRQEVNALGNFCFLTKDTNLKISDRLPEEYFPEIEQAHPGALASQWIPMDRELWKINHYREFLKARRELLAAELNLRMESLLHGDTRWLANEPRLHIEETVVGGISSAEEETELEGINDWIEKQGFSRGILSYEYADPTSGQPQGIFDLVWPNGLQEELSQPVAVLLNEEASTIALASLAGFRCFTRRTDFETYVKREILAEDNGAQETLT